MVLLNPIKAVPHPLNGYLSGGAVRDLVLGLQPKDYDYFYVNNDTLLSDIKVLRDNEVEVHRKKSRMYEANLFGDRVQLCLVPNVKDHEAILNGFDLTHCMVGWNNENGIFATQQGFDALSTGKMKINRFGSSATLSRIFRFMRRGWDLDKEDFLAFMQSPIRTEDMYDNPRTMIVDIPWIHRRIEFTGTDISIETIGTDISVFRGTRRVNTIEGSGSLDWNFLTAMRGRWNLAIQK